MTPTASARYSSREREADTWRSRLGRNPARRRRRWSAGRFYTFLCCTYSNGRCALHAGQCTRAERHASQASQASQGGRQARSMPQPCHSHVRRP